MKVLGVWLDEDMSWDFNTKQLCQKAFARINMLCKLKYVGIKREDLLTIYKLFIRSVSEYCSVVFHTSLTIKQSKKIELIQSTSLKVILDSDYCDYESALQLCNLNTLSERRQVRLERFAVKCVKDKFNKNIFPLNNNIHNKDSFQVNFARTNKYLISAVPQCQRLLNKLAKDDNN